MATSLVVAMADFHLSCSSIVLLTHKVNSEINKKMSIERCKERGSDDGESSGADVLGAPLPLPPPSPCALKPSSVDWKWG